MKSIFYSLFIIILGSSCENRPKKIVAEKYDDGTPMVIYTIHEGNIENIAKAHFLCLYDNGQKMKEGYCLEELKAAKER